MKVLTATRETRRPGDVCGVDEGELVLPIPACATCSQPADADPGCVCQRAWWPVDATTIATRYTTIAMVRDRDLTLADYTEVIRRAVASRGNEPTLAACEQIAQGLLFMYRTDPPGTVVERHGAVETVRR